MGRDINNPQSINGVLRNRNDTSSSITYQTITIHMQAALLIHSMLIVFICIARIRVISIQLGYVRGESPIIKQIPVPSSFGNLVIYSAVAPHDKIDVSRQIPKTIQFSSKDVCGNVINLHGQSTWRCNFVEPYIRNHGFTVT